MTDLIKRLTGTDRESLSPVDRLRLYAHDDSVYWFDADDAAEVVSIIDASLAALSQAEPASLAGQEGTRPDVDAVMSAIEAECRAEKLFLGTVNACEVIRKHLAAALSPAPAGVQVKALEWERAGVTSQSAETIVGCYLIEYRQPISGSPQWYWHPLGRGMMPVAGELEAKSAAQADYETRIRSALIAPPAAGAQAVPVAWVDQVMEQAQVFASAYSLVGGRFDDGNAKEYVEEVKAELRAMLAAAPASPVQAMPVASGPVPTHECPFSIGQPVRLAGPYPDIPGPVVYVTGISWEHRMVPARGWNIMVAGKEDIEKGYGQTDGYTPDDLLPASPVGEER